MTSGTLSVRADVLRKLDLPDTEGHHGVDRGHFSSYRGDEPCWESNK